MDHCIRELSASESRRRGFSYRLDLDGERLLAFTTVNGFDEPLPKENGCARIEFQLDATGKHVVSTLCRNPTGSVRARTLFEGARVEWLDAWGHPRTDGPSGLLRRFDTAGHVIGYRYVDGNGHPVANDQGVFEIRLRANAAGENIESSYFDAAGSPMLCNDGYHRAVYEADGFGGWLTERYYGVDGRPTTDHQGVHLTRLGLDDVGNMVRESYWGLDGRPARRDGFHALQNVRNARGEIVEIRLLDEAGKLLDGKNGYAIQKRSYDKRGRPVEWAYFKTDGSVAVVPRGYHRRLVELDANGQELVERFIGADERPVLGDDGYAFAQTTYDVRGNRTSRRLFGVQDEPTADRNWVHLTNWERDPTDQVIAITTFDAGDARVDARDGYARVTIARGADGSELRRDYFDATGAGVDVGTYSMVALRYRKGTAQPPDAGAEGDDAARAARESSRKLLALLAAGADLRFAAAALGLEVTTFTSARRTLIREVKRLAPGETSQAIDWNGAVLITHRDK